MPEILANAAMPALATAVAVAPDTVDVRNANRGATAAFVQAGPSERAQLSMRKLLTDQ